MPVDEIIVTADFRGARSWSLPASISDHQSNASSSCNNSQRSISRNSSALIPNLNWSGDGHRARYFQIRGVGELEQYQGAPNPSIGFLIDDIDFSGIGTVSRRLFDMQRIEVLRGSSGKSLWRKRIGRTHLHAKRLTKRRAEWSIATLSAGDDDAYSPASRLAARSNDERACITFRLQCP